MTAMTDDPNFERRLRAAFAATARTDAPTADCPPASEIWDAVAESLEPRRLRQLINHVASCPACTESWRLASEVAGDGASGAASAPEAAARRSHWAAWASAAAASLGFAFFSLTYDQAPPGASIARAGADHGPVLELIAPQQPAAEPGCRARWTEFEGATYDVQVLSDDLELLAERTNLAEPGFRIPEESLASLPAGSELRIHIAVKRGLAGVVADGTFDLRCVR